MVAKLFLVCVGVFLSCYLAEGGVIPNADPDAGELLDEQSDVIFDPLNRLDSAVENGVENGGTV